MAENKNIELIRGDPKVAIRKLSVPTTIAMLIVMVYNLTDSIWIAGIGANAIAATGFTAPLYMFIGGVGNAIGLQELLAQRTKSLQTMQDATQS